MDPDSVQLQTDDGEALDAIAALGTPCAESRDAVYLTAVNQRSLNLDGAALATLERLRVLHPRFSRLYEERGYCLAAMNDMPGAIDAFEQGVNINAALPSSWSMLERLYRIAGDSKKAAAAAEHTAMLRRLPAQIVEAGALFSDGDLAAAEGILRTFLRNAGNHAEALRLLGRIAHQRNALEPAETFLEQALRLAPAYRAARADYARVLIDRLKYLQARAELADLLQLDPGNADYRTLEATALAGIGKHDVAIEAYRELAATTPGWSHLHLLLGNSLKAIGRHAEAIESYRAAADAHASFADACWSLANLKTYRFSLEEMERMRAEEAARATQLADRYALCFSLGKAFEDRGEYVESWRYYERGNALKRAQSGYDPQFAELEVRRQTEVCTSDFFAAHTGIGMADPAPIFIVGLPRAGSTLIEQILASHSKVEGTQELHDVERIARELGGPELGGPRPDTDGPRYPAVLAELARDDFRRLGERYLSDTRVYRKGRPFFIDKMPNNFRHIGLIHLMLPRAKIIDVRRVLQFCELEFEAGCTEYYKTARSVSTASSEQVRQPIFRAGLSRWRHYKAWLGPLKDALGDAVVRYR
jgi:tetratricopeptide (TPR) repeat protein